MGNVNCLIIVIRPRDGGWQRECFTRDMCNAAFLVEKQRKRFFTFSYNNKKIKLSEMSKECIENCISTVVTKNWQFDIKTVWTCLPNQNGCFLKVVVALRIVYCILYCKLFKIHEQEIKKCIIFKCMGVFVFFKYFNFG